MADDNSKKRLGRGLAALIGDMDEPVGSSAKPAAQPDRIMPIEQIAASKNNPRRQFVTENLEELAASIKEHGVIQPIVVRPRPDGTHEIIAGERRWRAAQLAGKTEVPVIIREVDDRVALELAIIENVQRSDLNAVEEALGYQQLMDEHGYTQNELGQVIAKSRSHVANTLRLLKLPDDVRAFVADGSLSAGHARTLVTADNPAALAKQIMAEGLSVRQAEQLAAGGLDAAATSGGSKGSAAQKSADTIALERTLSDALGYKVVIDHKEPGGKLTVHYKTLEQLDAICHRLQAG